MMLTDTRSALMLTKLTNKGNNMSKDITDITNITNNPNNDEEKRQLKLSAMKWRKKFNPDSMYSVQAVLDYGKADRQTVDLDSMFQPLADRWFHCQDYDFSHFLTYLSALTATPENRAHLEKFGMAYIRLDDLTEIFRLANEQVLREWEEDMAAQREEDEAEEQAEYEAQLDHGSEIINQLSSVSWNLNRIASQLEKGSKASAQPRSDLHEQLLRKNTHDLLRGGNS